MIQRLRRAFLTGVIVIVPLVVGAVALVWLLRWADSLTSGIEERMGLTHVPGLGIVVTAAIVLLIGVLANNVLGRRLLQQTERLLMLVPLFRTIYAPVKQLLQAFSPDSEFGFKRMVFVEDPIRGFVLGFLTKEFTIDRGGGPEPMLAVYVPTNHLYLGDVVLCRPSTAFFPRMTVEEGIRVFLTGGMALDERLAVDRSTVTSVGTTPES